MSLSNNGLCKSCDPVFLMDVHQRSRIIKESLEIIELSTKLDTQISRCDVVAEHAIELLNYEHNQISTIKPKPSELVTMMKNKKDSLIYDAMKNEATKVSGEENYGNRKSKVSKLAKLLLKISEYKNKYYEDATSDNHTNLASLEKNIKAEIDNLNIAALLDDAQKAEFKKQSKKALDKYYDVLYYINHDSIDDSLQIEKRDHARERIIALGGDVPE